MQNYTANTQAPDMYLLAIESSCDDTGIAVLHNGNILANMVAGQAVHQAWGGVVPELASRAHEKNIVPTVDAALKQAGITVSQLSAIAFTAGPGLVGSLMVGVGFAKALALSLNIPLIQTDHLVAHVMSSLIGKPDFSFPYLCLLVSGGHTQIIRVDAPLKMEVLGSTNDDAAGEAFDKAAKMLGLPYPGGPLIDKYAKDGDSMRFPFPRPRAEKYDYSFSGLKTAYLQFISKQTPEFLAQNLPDICASIQHSIVDYLFIKLKLAASDTGIKTIAIAGGVAANTGLRNRLTQESKTNDWQVHIPAFEYCTDNAGMIAITAWYQFLQRDFAGQDAVAYARGG